MGNNETIHERISQLVDKYGDGKNTVFASLIGSNEANVRGYRNNTMPKYDFLEKIAKCFDINLKWLLTGEGSMFDVYKSYNNSNTRNLTIINQDYKGSPYYNVDFIGGFDLLMNDQTINPDFYINYPPYNKDGVVWVNLTGRSMEPELSNGDIIALKPMNTPIQYLPTKEIYAIVTEEWRTVKRIELSDRDGFIRLLPSNPEYKAQEIPISMITRVYAVLGSIRKFF